MSRKLCIAAQVDIRRSGGLELVRIPAGIMVSETDLSSREVDDLVKDGLVRKATLAERAAFRARRAGRVPKLYPIRLRVQPAVNAAAPTARVRLLQEGVR
jgi:hypothetical protein